MAGKHVCWSAASWISTPDRAGGVTRDAFAAAHPDRVGRLFCALSGGGFAGNYCCLFDNRIGILVARIRRAVGVLGRGAAAGAGRLRRVRRPPGSLAGTTCATPSTRRPAAPRSGIATSPRGPTGRGPALRTPVVRVRIAPRARQHQYHRARVAQLAGGTPFRAVTVRVRIALRARRGIGSIENGVSAALREAVFNENDLIKVVETAGRRREVHGERRFVVI